MSESSFRTRARVIAVYLYSINLPYSTRFFSTVSVGRDPKGCAREVSGPAAHEARHQCIALQQARCRLRPPDGSPIPRQQEKKFEVARMPGPQAGARAAE